MNGQSSHCTIGLACTSSGRDIDTSKATSLFFCIHCLTLPSNCTIRGTPRKWLQIKIRWGVWFKRAAGLASARPIDSTVVHEPRRWCELPFEMSYALHDSAMKACDNITNHDTRQHDDITEWLIALTCVEFHQGPIENAQYTVFPH